MRKRQDAYVMLDIEASGTRMGYHDLIQFGAIAVFGPALETQKIFPAYQPQENLPINLVKPHFKGEPNPGSMKVNGLNWQEVVEHGEEPQDFITRFRKWILELKSYSEVKNVILTGHGLVFDWSFLKLLHDSFYDDWPCHYSGLDFKSWYGGAETLEYIDASQTHMRRKFNFEKNKSAHDAFGDARYQLDLMLQTFQSSGLIADHDA